MIARASEAADGHRPLRQPSSLATYAREDLVAALDRAGRCRPFSLSAVERILRAQAQLKSPIATLAEEWRSTILITKVDFDAWAQYLGDAPLAMAMLDWLVDGAPWSSRSRAPPTNL